MEYPRSFERFKYSHGMFFRALFDVSALLRFLSESLYFVYAAYVVLYFRGNIAHQSLRRFEIGTHFLRVVHARHGDERYDDSRYQREFPVHRKQDYKHARESYRVGDEFGYDVRVEQFEIRRVVHHAAQKVARLFVFEKGHRRKLYMVVQLDPRIIDEVPRRHVQHVRRDESAQPFDKIQSRQHSHVDRDEPETFLRDTRGHHSGHCRKYPRRGKTHRRGDHDREYPYNVMSFVLFCFFSQTDKDLHNGYIMPYPLRKINRDARVRASRARAGRYGTAGAKLNMRVIN